MLFHFLYGLFSATIEILFVNVFNVALLIVGGHNRIFSLVFWFLVLVVILFVRWYMGLRLNPIHLQSRGSFIAHQPRLIWWMPFRLFDGLIKKFAIFKVTRI